VDFMVSHCWGLWRQSCALCFFISRAALFVDWRRGLEDCRALSRRFAASPSAALAALSGSRADGRCRSQRSKPASSCATTTESSSLMAVSRKSCKLTTDIPKEMAPTEKYGSRQLPRVQCGLGLGIGTTARAGAVSVTGALSLCVGSGCQLGFNAQYPPPPTMAGWHSSMLS
jgi:hypothetical protein